MNNIVSVIIPSYGGGQYLERCVDSVLNQTYPYIEIVVVDDNGIGTPNQLSTAQVMAKYKDNERIKYVCHEKNQNGSAARNTGVKHAIGSYIALLDDDDEFYPTNIEEHMKVLPHLHEDYALTYCGLEEYLDGKLLRTVQRSFSGQDLYGILRHSIVVGSTSMCIKRSAWEELNGFDESFQRHQDWEFSARLMAKYKVKALPHIGFKRYLVLRNSPKNPDIAIKYRKHYLDKMKPLIATLSQEQQKDVVIYNMLDVLLSIMKNKEYGKFFKEYLKLHPGIRGVKFFYNRIMLVISRGYISIN